MRIFLFFSVTLALTGSFVAEADLLTANCDVRKIEHDRIETKVKTRVRVDCDLEVNGKEIRTFYYSGTSIGVESASVFSRSFENALNSEKRVTVTFQSENALTDDDWDWVSFDDPVSVSYSKR